MLATSMTSFFFFLCTIWRRNIFHLQRFFCVAHIFYWNRNLPSSLISRLYFIHASQTMIATTGIVLLKCKEKGKRNHAVVLKGKWRLKSNRSSSFLFTSAALTLFCFYFWGQESDPGKVTVMSHLQSNMLENISIG